MPLIGKRASYQNDGSLKVAQVVDKKEKTRNKSVNSGQGLMVHN